MQARRCLIWSSMVPDAGCVLPVLARCAGSNRADTEHAGLCRSCNNRAWFGLMCFWLLPSLDEPRGDETGVSSPRGVNCYLLWLVISIESQSRRTTPTVRLVLTIASVGHQSSTQRQLDTDIRSVSMQKNQANERLPFSLCSLSHLVQILTAVGADGLRKPPFLPSSTARNEIREFQRQLVLRVAVNHIDSPSQSPEHLSTRCLELRQRTMAGRGQFISVHIICTTQSFCRPVNSSCKDHGLEGQKRARWQGDDAQMATETPIGRDN